MSLTVRPEFIYGHRVEAGINDKIDFGEGASPLLATVSPGDYSMGEITTAIATALNAVGSLTYTCVVDRATRKFTIAASGNFELLAASGSSIGTGIYQTIGFSAVDLAGADTYEGQSASGSVYRPQYIPQNLMESAYNKIAIQPSVQESASGLIRVIRFGTRQFIEMEIVNITNEPQGDCSTIENNQNAVQQAVDFLEYATLKANFEYIEDPASPEIFEVVLLESTQASKDGTDYELRREFGRGSPNYFTMGDIVFRKVS